MFEVDGAADASVAGAVDAHVAVPVEVVELDAKAALSTATRLRATIDRAEADLLAVAAHYADLHPQPASRPASASASGEVLPGMERTVVLGGEGCPSVTEFAAVEFGAAVGYSSGCGGGVDRGRVGVAAPAAAGVVSGSGR